MTAPDLSRDGMRQARLRALDGFWGETQEGDDPNSELGTLRFAAISSNDGIYYLSTYATMREALAMISDEVLSGNDPVGVVDLDTGAAHGVHIGTPIVTDTGAEGAPGLPWGDVDTETLESDETNGETSHGPRYWAVPASAATFSGETGYVIEHAGTRSPVGQMESSSTRAYGRLEGMNIKVDQGR